METIIISVMVSIGLLLFFFCRVYSTLSPNPSVPLSVPAFTSFWLSLSISITFPSACQSCPTFPLFPSFPDSFLPLLCTLILTLSLARPFFMHRFKANPHFHTHSINVISSEVPNNLQLVHLSYSQGRSCTFRPELPLSTSPLPSS